MQEPRPRSGHLHAGHHLANQQAPARLIPEPQRIPGFDAIYPVSTRHQWFACARLRDPHLPRSMARLFPRRSPPQLLTAAARGGLRPPPARRPRRATRPTGPGSSISCTAPHLVIWSFYIQPPSAFVFTPSRREQSRARAACSLLLRARAEASERSGGRSESAGFVEKQKRGEPWVECPPSRKATAPHRHAERAASRGSSRGRTSARSVRRRPRPESTARRPRAPQLGDQNQTEPAPKRGQPLRSGLKWPLRSGRLHHDDPGSAGAHAPSASA